MLPAAPGPESDPSQKENADTADVIQFQLSIPVAEIEMLLEPFRKIAQPYVEYCDAVLKKIAVEQEKNNDVALQVQLRTKNDEDGACVSSDELEGRNLARCVSSPNIPQAELREYFSHCKSLIAEDFLAEARGNLLKACHDQFRNNFSFFEPDDLDLIFTRTAYQWSQRTWKDLQKIINAHFRARLSFKTMAGEELNLDSSVCFADFKLEDLSFSLFEFSKGFRPWLLNDAMIREQLTPLLSCLKTLKSKVAEERKQKEKLIYEKCMKQCPNLRRYIENQSSFTFLESLSNSLLGRQRGIERMRHERDVKLRFCWPSNCFDPGAKVKIRWSKLESTMERHRPADPNKTSRRCLRDEALVISPQGTEVQNIINAGGAAARLKSLLAAENYHSRVTSGANANIAKKQIEDILQTWRKQNSEKIQYGIWSDVGRIPIVQNESEDDEDDDDDDEDDDFDPLYYAPDCIVSSDSGAEKCFRLVLSWEKGSGALQSECLLEYPRPQSQETITVEEYRFFSETPRKAEMLRLLFKKARVVVSRCARLPELAIGIQDLLDVFTAWNKMTPSTMSTSGQMRSDVETKFPTVAEVDAYLAAFLSDSAANRGVFGGLFHDANGLESRNTKWNLAVDYDHLEAAAEDAPDSTDQDDILRLPDSLLSVVTKHAQPSLFSRLDETPAVLSRSSVSPPGRYGESSQSTGNIKDQESGLVEKIENRASTQRVLAVNLSFYVVASPAENGDESNQEYSISNEVHGRSGTSASGSRCSSITSTSSKGSITEQRERKARQERERQTELVDGDHLLVFV